MFSLPRAEKHLAFFFSKELVSGCLKTANNLRSLCELTQKRTKICCGYVCLGHKEVSLSVLPFFSLEVEEAEESFIFSPAEPMLRWTLTRSKDKESFFSHCVGCFVAYTITTPTDKIHASNQHQPKIWGYGFYLNLMYIGMMEFD